MSRRILFLVVSVVVLLGDQLSKLWAAATLKDSFGRVHDVEVIQNLLTLGYTVNRGIALGILGDGGAATKWILVVVSVGAAIFVAGYLFRASTSDKLLMAALSLLLAGILGNLLDRVAYGYVIDFISFHYNEWQFPVFNLADSAISVGAVLMAVDLLRSPKKSEEPAQVPQPVAEHQVNLDENV